ncbi:MAG: zinc ABC transporter substrate-binding protein [Parachlamydiales bacterium]|jgi:manganese/zinc/iron transport system substrate-binding protein
MRKYLGSIFIIISCLLSACSPSPHQQAAKKWMEKNGKIKTLSTTGMIGDLISNIGGEHVDNFVLIGELLDPHSYQLVKGDDEKFAFAQLIFYNGLNLEHGPSLHAALENHPRASAIGDAIINNNPSQILHHNGQLDPHVWMDISLWSQAIPTIVNALSKFDPDHSQDYAKNGQKLKLEMLAAHNRVKAKLHAIPSEKRYLVTSHDAFNYFSRAYLADESELTNGTWEDRFAAPEGLAPDSQLGAGDIRKIIDHMDKYHIMVIFPESNVSKDSIRKIVSAGREKGLTLTIATDALYGDAMGPKDSDGNTYLKMIEHNAVILSRYLSGNGKEERQAALLR